MDAAGDHGRRRLCRRACLLLFALRSLPCSRHSSELARLVTREHGKVLSDAAGEVARGLECVDFGLRGSRTC